MLLVICVLHYNYSCRRRVGLLSTRYRQLHQLLSVLVLVSYNINKIGTKNHTTYST